MQALFTERFSRSFVEAPPDIQKRFGQALAHLLRNRSHPSLHAKKYDEADDLWQARVTDDWRFFFRIEGSIYKLMDITPHPK